MPDSDGRRQRAQIAPKYVESQTEFASRKRLPCPGFLHWTYDCGFHTIEEITRHEHTRTPHVSTVI